VALAGGRVTGTVVLSVSQPRCRRSAGIDNRDAGVLREVKWGGHLLVDENHLLAGTDLEMITVGEADHDKAEVSGTSAV
jgi:FKBP-type peptidyl-prolyl cis-trans isomerase 2